MTMRLPLKVEVLETSLTNLSLRFTTTNPTDGPLCVLPWYTPFEGMRSNCMEIAHKGESAQYQGIMARRAAPTADMWVELAAGETLSKEVKLYHDSGFPLYSVEAGKKYSLRSVSGIRYHVGPKSTVKDDEAGQGTEVAEWEFSPVEFEVVEG